MRGRVRTGYILPNAKRLGDLARAVADVPTSDLHNRKEVFVHILVFIQDRFWEATDPIEKQYWLTEAESLFQSFADVSGEYPDKFRSQLPVVSRRDHWCRGKLMYRHYKDGV